MFHKDNLKRYGFSVIDSVLDERQVAKIRDEVIALSPGEGVHARSGRIFGARNLLRQVPSLKNTLQREILGSYVEGLIGDQPNQIEQLTSNEDPKVCSVTAGGALFMKPLLLHSSLSCRNPVHRRVLHNRIFRRRTL